VTIPFRAIVAMIHVRSIPASIRFYETIGFTVANTFVPPDATDPTWVWLESEAASLMLARATDPVIADRQAALFYLYTDDVPTKHTELAAAGLNVSKITSPFYAPHGEFRLVDPDGYVLMITHT
jgi:predicted enzyme related to lactoylglutathione lyase